MSKKDTFITIIVIAMLLLSLKNHPLLALEYQIIDLGTLGGTDTQAHGLNEIGQVVGISNSKPFIWQNGVMTNLGSLGGSQGYALDINNSGKAVGVSYTNATNFHGFMWDSTNGMTDLGTFGGSNSTARTINDNGKIAGAGQLLSGGYDAYIWDSLNEKVPIAPLGGDQASINEITNTGKLAFNSRIQDGGPNHGFYGENNVFQDVGTLNGSQVVATDVNNFGQLVGFALDGSEWHIFLWNITDGTTDLGLLSSGWDLDGFTREVISINDAGIIAGRRLNTNGDSIAFMYDTNTDELTDLYDLLPQNTDWDSLDVARDINENGQIVGQGTKNGETRAFFISPVPEPSLIILSIIGCGWLFTRKKK